MVEIIIPREAIVVIYGPSCAGKSTLAQKIYHESGQRDHLKFLFSVVQEYPAAILRTPGAVPFCRPAKGGGFYLSPNLPAEVAQRLAQVRSERLAEVLEKYPLMVYDGIFLSQRELAQQLLAMSFGFGLWRPTILIKMLPHPELHEAFYLERVGKCDNTCLPSAEVLRQRNEFAAQIMYWNFASGWPVEADFYEYAITDPRMIELLVE